MGFRIQFCFQILTIEIEKDSFKQRNENLFFGRKMPFLTKITYFDDFSNFSVEAEKLIFPAKWVVLAPKQFAKYLTD